jgi:hypothetical protein
MKQHIKKFVPVSIVFASAIVLAACQGQSEETPAADSAPAAPADVTETEQATTATNSMVTELRTVGAYESPAGAEEIGIVLFVDESGIITNAEAEVMAENTTSKFRQQSFADGLSEAVVGIDIAELENIDRVGGSSLTTNAFNQSIATLQEQAS